MYTFLLLPSNGNYHLIAKGVSYLESTTKSGNVWSEKLIYEHNKTPHTSLD
jgi:hypothetical protein